jgi:NAD(P)-dependent dehydrogenase (short-subunit alcohol dehydrogenase family)
VSEAQGTRSGRLAGKWALVTGSTRGLGRTMAEWLAREGANIVVSGRNGEDVSRAVAAIDALGVRTIGIPADLAIIADAHKLATEAIARAGQVDILVNNAGMSIPGAFWDASDEDFEYQTNVNFRSPFILCQHLAKHWIASKTRGRIVNISTIGAQRCHRDKAIYDAAKAAVEAMTRNMAYELGPHGIGVNCVVPGAIPVRPGTEWEDPWKSRAAQYIPLGRAGCAEDIASAVVYFCLPESEFTTGQSLLVDGGHGSYLVE